MSLLERLFSVNEYELVESYFRSTVLIKDSIENNQEKEGGSKNE